MIHRNVCSTASRLYGRGRPMLDDPTLQALGAQILPIRPRIGAAVARTKLRLMATSDLHMQLLSYDYDANRRCGRGALARVAGLIETLRQDGLTTLLFDNGDLIQGNAMGDLVAQAVLEGQPHPAIAAMNALGYDAAAPGNHDFNYGVETLMAVARGAKFPFVCSNLRLRGTASVLRNRLILRRRVRLDDGRTATLRIGVMGLLPPQTVEWDRAHIGARGRARDICEAAADTARLLRRDGADLVVALAHTGIGAALPEPWMEDAAAALAAMADVDAVIAGHSHRVFPSALFRGNRQVDPVSGTLWGKPAVQPGQRGSHLGVIDLDLTRDAAGHWSVSGHRSRALPVPEDQVDAPSVVAATAAAHAATLHHMRRQIGHTARPLNTFFAMVAPNTALGLIAEAQRWHVQARLAGTPLAGLPVLCAVAPFKAGGIGGPFHYTHIDAGPLTLGSLSDLYSFPNRIEALKLSGRELVDWLERSASAFLQLQPHAPDQPLIDPDFPSYEFDVITGISYAFDLTQPRRYAACGRLVDPAAARVRDIRLNGRALAEDDQVILATSNYRTASRGFGVDRLALRAGPRAHEVLRDYVEGQDSVSPADPDWRFVPVPGASALFDTAPEAAAYLPKAGAVRIEPAGDAPDGFARFRLAF